MNNKRAWHVCAGAVSAGLVWIGTLSSTVLAQSMPSCVPAVGRIVSYQGDIQLQRGGAWYPVRRLETLLCSGDLVRTGAHSRAALVLVRETFVRVDQNATLSLRPEGDEVQVEMFTDARCQAGPARGRCGAGYFITRFPKKFKVYTPYLNAAVEGTEFHLALSDDGADLDVFEGKVLAQSALTQDSGVRVESNQSVSAPPNQSLSSIRQTLRPRDAVQWALFYPGLAESADATSECGSLPAAERAPCQVASAQALLRVGRVDEARAQLAALLDRSDAEALALASIIALVKNEDARPLAEEAVSRSRTSSRAWLALSYVQQADFELEPALDSARQAARLAPGSALMRARVAELLMSLGETGAAQREALEAVRINPDESRAHTVLGFLYLARLQGARASAAFGRASELDSSDPMPRLGAGLALIRAGDLARGREQIEIALVLDPQHALIRSYAGKAYYEENTRARDDLAHVQFDLAKALDEHDPTPHFYSAILKHSQNRAVEALEELVASIRKNDQRAVYRSRLLLDQDASARAVSLAGIYRALGFDQAALPLASASLERSPNDYGAHRFLADAYATLPRHEAARASEFLQATLLQPISAFGPRPCALDADSIARRPALPAVGQVEYSELFEKDVPRIAVGAVKGDQGRADAEGSVSMTKGPLALGVFGCESQNDEFRTNQDYARQRAGMHLQYAVTADLALHMELTREVRRFGDISYQFDPQLASASERNKMAISAAHLGARYQLSAGSDVIALLAANRRDANVSDGSPGVFALDLRQLNRSWQAELQLLRRTPRSAVIVGGGNTQLLSSEQSQFQDFLTPFTDLAQPKSHSRQSQLYVYSRTALSESLSVVGGLSYDSLRDEPVDQNRLNPKLGVRWTPTAGLTLRAAAFRSARRFFVENRTIEPTQIVGFNQFYDNQRGARAETLGVGLDSVISPSVSAGLEAARRELEVPILEITQSGNVYKFAPQEENTLRAYAYWAVSRRVTLAFEPSVQRFTRDNPIASDNLATEVRTTQIPLSARWILPQGLTISATARAVQQYVDRRPEYRSTLAVGHERYTLLDAALIYRMPGRRVTFALEVHNLTDRRFRYQDDNTISRTDIVPSRVFPERTVWFSTSLRF